MHIEFLDQPTEQDWFNAKRTALKTERKEIKYIPDENWKAKILISEHSIVRKLIYNWIWTDIPYWVSMHLKTHNVGITQFVTTQRNDRQKEYDRNKAPQDSLVDHEGFANAQSIINISKVRLCNKASKETREVWMMLVNKLESVDNNLYQLCVPTCVYRNGICPEPKCCGYNKSTLFLDRLQKYLNFIQRKD